MIGKLNGVIDSIGEDFVILDVHGVGYIVHCSGRTLAHLPRVGEAARLIVETQLREDSIKLYGFLTEVEREWFRLLQTVQGIGAKVALAVQSALSAEELALAIARQDKAQIARAPGIGPRLAARLLAELKDKAPAAASSIPLPAAGMAPAADDQSLAVQDAFAALLTLGYGRPQAGEAIAGAQKMLGGTADTAALVRQALKQLVR